MAFMQSYHLISSAWVYRSFWQQQRISWFISWLIRQHPVSYTHLPALSAADVGIAISDGAELAREIADITIGAEDLSVMVTLKEISNGLMDKIHKNYRRIVGINGSLIALGVTGVIQPTMSALLHNTSTLLIGMDLSLIHIWGKAYPARFLT